MHKEPEMSEHAELFSTIADNLNILREVQRNPTPDQVFRVVT